jgi:hypothetical protein
MEENATFPVELSGNIDNVLLAQFPGFLKSR